MNPLPEALLRELRPINGFDEAAFVASHGLPPVTSIRRNPHKLIPLPEAAPVPWCADGFYFDERPVFTLDPAYHAGAYYVQEASSMFLGHLLGTVLQGNSQMRVLDLCAAPGGKSTHIASLLDKESLLISNEVIRSRVSVLEENLARWGHMNTWVTCNDPRDFGRLPGYFDVIVVDAPCSGSGLFRKDGRALTEWSEANVNLCCARQQRILADVWPALRENGILIYATCSYSPREDEQILEWQASNFEVRPVIAPPDSKWGVVTVNGNGLEGYRFFPDRVRGEGFFIAAVRKKDPADSARPIRFKSLHDKKIQAQAGYLLRDTDCIFLATGKDAYAAIGPGHEADLHLLQTAVYLRQTGLKLGNPSAKEWLPAHEVALSIDASQQLPGASVTREQALRFLKREDPEIADVPRGWHIVRYQGLGLGWIKSLGNRVNNYLPKNLRIRMEIPDED